MGFRLSCIVIVKVKLIDCHFFLKLEGPHASTRHGDFDFLFRVKEINETSARLESSRSLELRISPLQGYSDVYTTPVHSPRLFHVIFLLHKSTDLSSDL